MALKLPGYKPITRLGSGSTGAVMSARDGATGTTVAIKQLSNDVYRAPGFADRFREDAETLLHIDNPHVAQVYEFVETPRSASVVTELVEGVSLRQLLDTERGIAPEAALYVLKGALIGLAEAHHRGVVHRDVKPENLIIDEYGVTKVVDFGIAAPYKRNAPAPGDPRYLAPELWSGRPATPSSDVYALAAVLFECFTGRAPVAADGGFIGRTSLPATYDSAAIQPASLPDRVRRLVARGLAFRPLKRPISADEMLDELELAALGAFGPNWEEIGKQELLEQIADIRQNGSRRSSTRRIAVGAAESRRMSGTVKVLLASAVVVLICAAAVVLSDDVFTAGSGKASGIPAIAHTPQVIVGPPVPSPSSGPHADKTKPEQVVGLHVTGRSQTGVTLTWNPSRDNTRVIGYIVNRDGVRIGTTYGPNFTVTGLAAATMYRFSVVAFDAAGNLSLVSATVIANTLTVPDTTAPSVPLDLRSTGRNTTTVFLAWQPSRDNIGVAGYDVFRDGVRVGSAMQPTYTDTGLLAGSTHRYAVRSYDTSNNASRNSAPITVTTLRRPDRKAPSVPTGLSATGTSISTVDLAWHASTDNIGVVRYLVYRGSKKIASVATTTYQDYALASGTTYKYTVRAVDAANNKSGASHAASGTTLKPTPTSPTPTPSSPAQGHITSVTLSASEISAPGCSTTVTAVVTADGPIDAIDISYSLGGASGTQPLTFNAAASKTVVLGTVNDVVADGTATADVGGQHGSTNWTDPSGCPPAPSSAPPTSAAPSASASDGGGGGDSGGGTGDGQASGAALVDPTS